MQGVRVRESGHADVYRQNQGENYPVSRGEQAAGREFIELQAGEQRVEEETKLTAENKQLGRDQQGSEYLHQYLLDQ